MDACHVLLGRPWQYDRSVSHDGRSNTYNFMFNNVKIMLIPKREVVPKPLVGEGSNLLSMSRFIKEVSKTGVVYVLLGKDHTVRGEAPKLVQEIIDEF